MSRPNPRGPFGAENGEQKDQKGDNGQDNTVSNAQQIALPKGGGAVKGIGEKFSSNPFTGTFSVSVPVFTTPSRSDFYPKLSLVYDSAGKGNGPVAMGWNFSIPSITRKTELGIPRYDDANVSDTFILSGAEDLVPLLDTQDGGVTWTKTIRQSGDFEVERYRPRVEGLFAKIEKWRSRTTGDTHWRSISKDNVTTYYGQTAESRISDPDDQGRVFEWMIDESRDDKGNVILYEYKQENADNVNPALAHERNRRGKPYSKRYVKRIRYGNAIPNETQLAGVFHFEVVFDYGEHDLNNQPYTETKTWPLRADPFSSYRSGFEIRSQRLCRRIMVFHLAFKELGLSPYLVSSTDLSYDETPITSFLKSVTQTGYIAASTTGTPGSQKSMPPLVFAYTQAELKDEVHYIDKESLANLPVGLDSSQYKWVDLDEDGVPGILSDQSGSWFYKDNLGGGRFAPERIIGTKPSIADLQGGRQEVTDFAGDGRTYLVEYANLSGFHERDEEGRWGPFMPFLSSPNIDWGDANQRFIDLDGDGRADLLFSQDQAFLWYRSLGREGFARAETVPKGSNEEKGPVLLFSDASQTIYIADMTGDGLGDLVRIRNGEICYWPNEGYGRFGAKVNMDDPPIFDYQDEFNEKRIRLADVDGSGTTDLLYLGTDGIRIWLNQSGNGWSKEERISSFPALNDVSSVTVIDLLGTGMSCVVWSSPLPSDAQQPMGYIDLMGGVKPYLLTSIQNNMGSQTDIQYASSTRFYLEDQAAGRPWITKLSFPVQVVEQITTTDSLSSTKLVVLYKYHHGFFDPVEREFRGFGLVEHWDAESFDQFSKPAAAPKNYDLIEEELYVPPVHTKTWFHTGTYYDWKSVSKHFAKEYYRGDNQAPILRDSSMPSGLAPGIKREAYRSLKGQILREEVYADDGTPQSKDPYIVSEHRYKVNLLQPVQEHISRYSSFYTYGEEAISCHYERNPADPRIEQTFVLQVDDYGNVQRTATVYHPRRGQYSAPQPGGPIAWTSETFPEQYQLKATLNLTDYAQIVDQDDIWITGEAYQSKSYELTLPDLRLGTDNSFQFSDIADSVNAALLNPLEFGIGFTGGATQARLYSWKRSYFWNTAQSLSLPLGSISSPLLASFSERAVAPSTYLSTQLPGATDAIMLGEGGYVRYADNDYWWAPGVKQNYFDASQFYLPQAVVDPFGNATTFTYDAYDLALSRSVDSLNNTIRAEMDYRVMQPWRLIDFNGNSSQVVVDELGMVTTFTVFGLVNGVVSGDSDLSGYQPVQNPSRDDIIANPEKYLQGATAYFYNDYLAWMNETEPTYAVSVHRAVHQSDLPGGQAPTYLVGILYGDGTGRQLQKKLMAGSGLAWMLQADGTYQEVNVPERWLTSGKTVFNNKGKPVKQYEPFFSAVRDYEFEDALVEFGVTPVIHYDPLDRVIRTDTPKGFYSEAVFDPWTHEQWDADDTAAESQFWKDIQQVNAGSIPNDWTHGDWSADRLKNEFLAVQQAVLQDYGTPKIAHVNNMGQVFMEVDILIDLTRGSSPTELYTHYELDVAGNKLSITDPRQYASAAGVKNFRMFDDMLDRRLVSIGTDNGTERVLQDALNKAIYVWNANGYTIHTQYDVDKLHRPTEVDVNGNGLNNIVEQIQYGESALSAQQVNLLGMPWQHWDQAGLREFLVYDIEKHNIQLRTTLRTQYKNEADWGSTGETLEAMQYPSSAAYDALNRVMVSNQSDGTVQKFAYHQYGPLASVNVNVAFTPSASGEYVQNISYNAKGQRESIQYGNGTVTTYTYENETFRLLTLQTQRSSNPKNTLVQDISYVYDPVGNITWKRDDAHKTIFTNETIVKPEANYSCDSLYRLTSSQGRQSTLVGPNDYKNPNAFKQSQYVPLGSINDSTALENYYETYQYDFAGNLEVVGHSASSGTSRGWTRMQVYDPHSNRILSSTVGGDTDSYAYDAAGDITEMEHLEGINWNYRNNISSAVLQQLDPDHANAEYYVYDSSGMRVRKVLEQYNKVDDAFVSMQVTEKGYLDGYEIKRIRKIDLQTNISTLLLERFSVHVMDDKKRIAITHRWTIDTTQRETDDPIAVKVHYHFADYVGSCGLELDDHENIISYEEYYPFGGTSIIAGNSPTASLAKEVTTKEYRYCGKEKDDSTDLYYYGARYYAPWLARWTSCDPITTEDGPNLYAYVKNSPLKTIDRFGMQGESNPDDQIEKRSIEYGTNSGGYSYQPTSTTNSGGPVGYSPNPPLSSEEVSCSAKTAAPRSGLEVAIAKLSRQKPTAVSYWDKAPDSVGRIIYSEDPEGLGFVPHYEQGTEAALDQRQTEENERTSTRMAAGLIIVASGIRAGSANPRAVADVDSLQHVLRGGPTDIGIGVLHLDMSVLSPADRSTAIDTVRDMDMQAGMAAGGLTRQQVTSRDIADSVNRLSKRALTMGGSQVAMHTPDVAGGGSPYGPIMAGPASVNSSFAGQWTRYSPGFTFTGYSLINRDTGQFAYTSLALEHLPAPITDFRR